MGKGKPGKVKREFLMEHFGVETLDELAEKLNSQDKKQVVQENDNVDRCAIDLFMQLDAEDIDCLIEKREKEI